MSLNKKTGFKAALFIAASILVYSVTHEFIHGMVAKQYGCTVTYDFIPGKNAFFRTISTSCKGDLDSMRFMQTIVEVVGYHGFIIHSAITGYVASQILNQ